MALARGRGEAVFRLTVFFVVMALASARGAPDFPALLAMALGATALSARAPVRIIKVTLFFIVFSSFSIFELIRFEVRHLAIRISLRDGASVRQVAFANNALAVI